MLDCGEGGEKTVTNTVSFQNSVVESLRKMLNLKASTKANNNTCSLIAELPLVARTQAWRLATERANDRTIKGAVHRVQRYANDTFVHFKLKLYEWNAFVIKFAIVMDCV